MKSIIFTLVSLGLSLPAFAAQTPCSSEVFLSKVCVSEQALALDGEEIGKLVCNDRSKYQSIYSTLENAFNSAPVWFQKHLCDLKQVGVYYPAQGTTLSWSYFPDQKFVGLSKVRMDQAYDLTAQTAIMMKQAKKLKTVPEGTVFPTDFGYQPTETDASSGILYLLAHEVGHILYNPADVKLRETYFSRCVAMFGSLNCWGFTEKQFGFIDWITGAGDLENIARGEIRNENKDLRSLILADASVQYTPQVADQLFRKLNSSDFVSPFAMYSPEEDFCETYAHLVMAESSKEVIFKYLSGDVISVWDRVRYPQEAGLKKKIEFIKILENR